MGKKKNVYFRWVGCFLTIGCRILIVIAVFKLRVPRLIVNEALDLCTELFNFMTSNCPLLALTNYPTVICSICFGCKNLTEDHVSIGKHSGNWLSMK